MAATVNVKEWNAPTATPVKTNKDGATCRFKNADNATVDTSNPLVIPASGQEYSYEKWLRFAATGAFTYLENLKFYTDGSDPYSAQNCVIWIRNVGTTFETPAVPNETQDPPQVPVNGTPGACTNAYTYVSATALALSTGTITATGDIGDFAVLVMEVNNGASPGVVTVETVTFQYDEV